MRYLPMDYMPLRRILSEMHAHEIHARKMHAHEVHAYEMHAREVQAREMHAHKTHVCEICAFSRGCEDCQGRVRRLSMGCDV